MSAKFTNDEWLLIFQQRTQSALSVRKWCDSNQISYGKYKYCEKKLLRGMDPERMISPMDFVELPQTLFLPLSPAQEQPAGARASGIVYTLVETAKLNYWKHIFPGLKHCQKAADSENIEENKKCMF